MTQTKERLDELEDAIIKDLGDGNMLPDTAAMFYLGLQVGRYVDLIEKNSAVGLDALVKLQEELAKESP